MEEGVLLKKIMKRQELLVMVIAKTFVTVIACVFKLKSTIKLGIRFPSFLVRVFSQLSLSLTLPVTGTEEIVCFKPLRRFTLLLCTST
ncbi:hypothetical protein EPI10_026112 [Gossypium australe]|uniref:Uncharacterized protein n=1 Tax=Gossypium australe TaxID=47621 RepID=A0A5B6W2Z8_9ROSI|nr:hypothetical protein EPI10_026112 [Gossypium australe]